VLYGSGFSQVWGPFLAHSSLPKGARGALICMISACQVGALWFLCIFVSHPLEGSSCLLMGKPSGLHLLDESISFWIHLQMFVLHDHHIHIHALLLCALVAITPCHHAPSSNVLLCLTQNTQHNGISNLVSLITKTKLWLSEARGQWATFGTGWGTGAQESRDYHNRAYWSFSSNLGSCALS
jgi:hypothetical protein